MGILTLSLLALAGGLGAAVRFITDGLIRTRFHTALPVSTILINVTGSLLLGLLVGLTMTGKVHAELEAVLGTGFLGGYTTFSTASVETVRLIQDGRTGRGLVNAFGTVLLSLAAALLGLFLGSIE